MSTEKVKREKTKRTEEIEETKFRFTNVWNQYFATAAVNLIMFAHGITMGWPSSAIPVLQDDNTFLISGPLTNDEVSWIGSIDALGAICGSITLGYLISLMGHKRAILLMAIPEVAFWIFIYFGNHYYYIIAARVVSGYAGGGIVPPLVLYVSEIANDEIRGRLASSMLILRNIGILVSYVLGATVDYFTIPIICVIFPVIFLMTFFLFPNTPQYHLHRGQTENAERALEFYKGYKSKSESEDKAFCKEFDRLKSIANERHTEEKIRASDFLHRSVLKGLAICFALNAFSQLTANHTIKTYAVMIFEHAGAKNVDKYLSSIMVALALIAGSLFTTYLADILGRKILNIVSLAGSAIGLFTVAIYSYLNVSGCDLRGFDWVPVVSVSFVEFISAAGINALAYVCSVEYLPLRIRTSGYVIVIVWLNMATFACTKLFPILLDVVKLYGCMTIFGIASTIGVIFVTFCMEETSGKSLDEDELDEVTNVQRVSVCINL